MVLFKIQIRHTKGTSVRPKASGSTLREAYREQ